MDRWMGGWMDGWVNGWMDGLMDGGMDAYNKNVAGPRWTARCIVSAPCQTLVHSGFLVTFESMCECVRWSQRRN
jgi:hypothetical protein